MPDTTNTTFTNARHYISHHSDTTFTNVRHYIYQHYRHYQHYNYQLPHFVRIDGQKITKIVYVEKIFNFNVKAFIFILLVIF